MIPWDRAGALSLTLIPKLIKKEFPFRFQKYQQYKMHDICLVLLLICKGTFQQINIDFQGL